MSNAHNLRSQLNGMLLNGALVSLFFCMLCAPPVFSQTNADQIMAHVYQQDTSLDAKLRATLDVTDKEGRTVKKRFTISRLGSFGNGKALVRFTDPPELRGVTLLSINEPGLTDRQWIYTPATERVRGVAPRERAERFAGSDFTFEDIAEPALEDF